MDENKILETKKLRKCMKIRYQKVETQKMDEIKIRYLIENKMKIRKSWWAPYWCSRKKIKTGGRHIRTYPNLDHIRQQPSTNQNTKCEERTDKSTE